MKYLDISNGASMSPEKHQKIIFISAIIGIILIIAIPIIIYLISSQYSATLTTIIAPSSATLTINNKTYPIDSDLHLKPQTITATISAEGFESQELTLDLSAGETSTLATYLIPNDGDISWYYQNSKENELLERVTDTMADQQANLYREKYPITSLLPLSVVDVDETTYSMKEYRIDVGEFSDCQTDFCLKITDMTGGNQSAAYDKLRENGYNPDDYEIIYEYKPYFTEAPARP